MRAVAQYVCIVLSSLTALLSIAALLASNNPESSFTLLTSSAFCAVSAGLLELAGLKS